jgi:hypothetical protein
MPHSPEIPRNALRRHVPRVIVVLAVVQVGVMVRGHSSAQAARPPGLLRHAIADTNSVRTLQYTLVERTSGATGSLITILKGAEDEVGNAEHDQEIAISSVKGKNGKTQQREYGVEIIFISGQTYWRYAFKQTAWHVRSGMDFTDPVLKVHWKRGRTKATVSSKLSLRATPGPNGTTRYAAHSAGTSHGVKYDQNLTYVVSGGKTPYIIEEDTVGPQSYQGKTQQVSVTQKFGPFDKPLSIKAPIQTT